MSPHAEAPNLFIGVDGGGTSCRVRIADAVGRRVGEAGGGPANVSLDFERALATIRQTIDAASESAGYPPASLASAAVGLGLAGVSSPAIAERVRAALPGFRSVVVRNDGIAACLGAHAGQDGGLVAAGTGSVAVLRLDGRETTFGGRGFLLGDDGSGAVVGRAIWRRALRACDGLEAMSPLLAALLAEFQGDPVAIIAWGRTAPSHAFAGYAPRVFAAATDGDPPALMVARDAGMAISDLIEALVRRGAPRIALVGGLARPIRPWLTPHAVGLLQEPLDDAVEGALLLAGAPVRREPSP